MLLTLSLLCSVAFAWALPYGPVTSQGQSKIACGHGFNCQEAAPPPIWPINASPHREGTIRTPSPTRIGPPYWWQGQNNPFKTKCNGIAGGCSGSSSTSVQQKEQENFIDSSSIQKTSPSPHPVFPFGTGGTGGSPSVISSHSIHKTPPAPAPFFPFGSGGAGSSPSVTSGSQGAAAVVGHIGVCPVNFICIHWQLCRNGQVITDGTAAIDNSIQQIPLEIRASYKVCGGPMICCSIASGCASFANEVPIPARHVPHRLTPGAGFPEESTPIIDIRLHQDSAHSSSTKTSFTKHETSRESTFSTGLSPSIGQFPPADSKFDDGSYSPTGHESSSSQSSKDSYDPHSPTDGSFSPTGHEILSSHGSQDSSDSHSPTLTDGSLSHEIPSSHGTQDLTDHHSPTLTDELFSPAGHEIPSSPASEDSAVPHSPTLTDESYSPGRQEIPSSPVSKVSADPPSINVQQTGTQVSGEPLEIPDTSLFIDSSHFQNINVDQSSQANTKLDGSSHFQTGQDHPTSQVSKLPLESQTLPVGSHSTFEQHSEVLTEEKKATSDSTHFQDSNFKVEQSVPSTDDGFIFPSDTESIHGAALPTNPLETAAPHSQATFGDQHLESTRLSTDEKVSSETHSTSDSHTHQETKFSTAEKSDAVINVNPLLLDSYDLPVVEFTDESTREKTAVDQVNNRLEESLTPDFPVVSGDLQPVKPITDEFPRFEHHPINQGQLDNFGELDAPLTSGQHTILEDDYRPELINSEGNLNFKTHEHSSDSSTKEVDIKQTESAIPFDHPTITEVSQDLSSITDGSTSDDGNIIGLLGTSLPAEQIQPTEDDQLAGSQLVTGSENLPDDSVVVSENNSVAPEIETEDHSSANEFNSGAPLLTGNEEYQSSDYLTSEGNKVEASGTPLSENQDGNIEFNSQSGQPDDSRTSSGAPFSNQPGHQSDNSFSNEESTFGLPASPSSAGQIQETDPGNQPIKPYRETFVGISSQTDNNYQHGGSVAIGANNFESGYQHGQIDSTGSSRTQGQQETGYQTGGSIDDEHKTFESSDNQKDSQPDQPKSSGFSFGTQTGVSSSGGESELEQFGVSQTDEQTKEAHPDFQFGVSVGEAPQPGYDYSQPEISITGEGPETEIGHQSGKPDTESFPSYTLSHPSPSNQPDEPGFSDASFSTNQQKQTEFDYQFEQHDTSGASFQTGVADGPKTTGEIEFGEPRIPTLDNTQIGSDDYQFSQQDISGASFQTGVADGSKTPGEIEFGEPRIPNLDKTQIGSDDYQFSQQDISGASFQTGVADGSKTTGEIEFGEPRIPSLDQTQIGTDDYQFNQQGSHDQTSFEPSGTIQSSGAGTYDTAGNIADSNKDNINIVPNLVVPMAGPMAPMQGPMMVGGNMMMGSMMMTTLLGTPLIGGSCSAGTFCIAREECNPYDGFIIMNHAQLNAVWPDSPKVPLLDCLVPAGGISNGVCCQLPHPLIGPNGQLID